jgi:hypothetical protein
LVFLGFAARLLVFCGRAQGAYSWPSAVCIAAALSSDAFISRTLTLEEETDPELVNTTRCFWVGVALK